MNEASHNTAKLQRIRDNEPVEIAELFRRARELENRAIDDYIRSHPTANIFLDDFPEEYMEPGDCKLRDIIPREAADMRREAASIRRQYNILKIIFDEDNSGW